MLGSPVSSSPFLTALSQPQNTSTPTSDPNDDGLDYWARDMVKAVCCIVAVLGGMGNLLTLCAVPYASRCCRAPLEVKRLRYSTATVFILNLAVADMLYCLVNLPLYYSQYDKPEVWKNSTLGCRFAGLLRYTIAAADWMSLAGIALNRCVCLLSFKWKGRIFGGWKSYVIILLIWLYGFLTQGLSILGLHGDYGWSNFTHKCDFLNKTSETQPRSDWFLISWSIPCVIIVISYSLIFIKVKQSGRSILRRNHSMDYVQALVRTREDKTSRMIFVVFLTYCVCVLPITVMNVADPENDFSNNIGYVQAFFKTREDKTSRMIFVVFLTYCMCVLPLTVLTVADPNNEYGHISLFIYCIYWWQYCCNNVIYVLSNSVYRKAYVVFLTDMVPSLKRFLRQPAPWQPRRNAVIAIGEVQPHSARGDADPDDSQPSRATANDSSPGRTAGRRTVHQQGPVGTRRAQPWPLHHRASTWSCDEVIRGPESVERHRRLAEWRRRLPLECRSGPLAGWCRLDEVSWRPLDDSGWRGVSLLDLRRRQDAAEDARAVRHRFCCDNPALDLTDRHATGSDLGAVLERKTLFGRQRSISF